MEEQLSPETNRAGDIFCDWKDWSKPPTLNAYRRTLMTTRLRRLTPSPIHEVDYQETSFSIDALARNICNTWEEAVINPVFDAVVIGCGMFGGCCAESSFETTGLQKSSSV